jgi:predicted phage terminase large subunit-like protein
LLDVKRVKLEFPHLKKLIQHKAMNADAIYIEDASSGTSLVQQLRSEGLYALSNSAKGDKVGRMIGQTGKLESGLVYVPKSAPWLAAFRAEISQFPNGKHDDQVDSLSQFLAHRAWILNQLKINPSVCAHLKKAPSSNYHLLA